MKITCLVDNAVEPGTLLWGVHGLALLIEPQDGRLLFDTGGNGSILLQEGSGSMTRSRPGSIHSASQRWRSAMLIMTTPVDCLPSWSRGPACR
jgi:hypothetical protein